MKQTYNSYEALFQLESFISQRNAKLADAFLEQVDSGRREHWVLPREALEDNKETQEELFDYFSQGLLGVPPKVTELHTTRCSNSGVAKCICLANRIVGTGEPI